MQRTSEFRTSLIVDASVCVWSAVPEMAGQDVRGRLELWRLESQTLAAPALWLSEVASAVRGAVHTRLISAARGEIALEELLAMEVEMVLLTPELTRSAYGWAERLGQLRAYDGFYLAAAEASGGEFWTADERLANAARTAGLGWVRWVGEPL